MVPNNRRISRSSWRGFDPSDPLKYAAELKYIGLVAQMQTIAKRHQWGCAQRIESLLTWIITGCRDPRCDINNECVISNTAIYMRFHVAYVIELESKYTLLFYMFIYSNRIFFRNTYKVLGSIHSYCTKRIFICGVYIGWFIQRYFFSAYFMTVDM